MMSSMDSPAKAYSSEWVKAQYQQLVTKLFDTEAKKLAFKVVVGVGVGAASAVILIKLYRRCRVCGTTKITLGNPNTLVKVKLSERKSLTVDTQRFRFTLPSSHHTLGVPPGNFIVITAIINGKTEKRPYTPISLATDKGFMDLVIKNYTPSPPLHPIGGVMSQYLHRLQVGEEIQISGPIGTLAYTGNGTFATRTTEAAPVVSRKMKRVGMIAAGSGITAIIPILRTILDELTDTPKCSIIYANKTDQDIIMREDLNKLALKHRNKFKLFYTVDKAIRAESWKYGTGLINEDMIKEWMPKPEAGVLVLICGPPSMVTVSKAALVALGYSEDMYFAF